MKTSTQDWLERQLKLESRDHEQRRGSVLSTHIFYYFLVAPGFSVTTISSSYLSTWSVEKNGSLHRNVHSKWNFWMISKKNFLSTNFNYLCICLFFHSYLILVSVLCSTVIRMMVFLRHCVGQLIVQSNRRGTAVTRRLTIISISELLSFTLLGTSFKVWGSA